MSSPLPIVLIPGLLATPRFYEPVLSTLWRTGPVTIARHTGDDSMAAIAQRILADAPPRFALAGHSMGGYIALEILRQAGDRVARLALLDTSALPDMPEQTEKRRALIDIARKGRFSDVPDLMFPNLVHPSRREDKALQELMRAMANDCGPEVFIRQQTAIMNRIDSRPSLDAIQCPALVVVGDSDAVTPPARAAEMVAGIAGATLVTLKDCGHMCVLEQAEAMNKVLFDWSPEIANASSVAQQ